MIVSNFRYMRDNEGDWLCINTKEAMNFLNAWKPSTKYEATIKEYHGKRSLNANAYAFSLLSQLAKKQSITLEKLYRKYIKESGIKTDVVCIQNKAVEAFCKAWEQNGPGWRTEKLDSKIQGCTNIVLYYGSSSFDSKEMASFINIIVQDCESVGIPTITKEQEKELLEKWGEIINV